MCLAFMFVMPYFFHGCPTFWGFFVHFFGHPACKWPLPFRVIAGGGEQKGGLGSWGPDHEHSQPWGPILSLTVACKGPFFLKLFQAWGANRGECFPSPTWNGFKGDGPLAHCGVTPCKI